MGQVIAHLDMDAFFVSVELLRRPELVGKPVIISRESARSVVLSASYEARAFGVRSALPLAKAKVLCPQVIVVEPSQNYGAYSGQVMAILRRLTDAVEQVSIDEAFIDLTGLLRYRGNPVGLMQEVRQNILTEVELPCSVGIAPTKFLAKMASGRSKPQGLWVIPPNRIDEFLEPLPVGQLWGVGPKTASSLESWGISNVKELKAISKSALMTRYGSATGQHLYNMARGIDPRKVVTERPEKSIGAEHTFATDINQVKDLEVALCYLAEKVAYRLRQKNKKAASLSLKIRYSNFETHTRSFLLPEPSNSAQVLRRYAVGRLADLSEDGELFRCLRLVGIRAEKMVEVKNGIQESLFAPELLQAENNAQGMPLNIQRWGQVEHTMDQIQARFGRRGLRPASFIKIGEGQP